MRLAPAVRSEFSNLLHPFDIALTLRISSPIQATSFLSLDTTNLNLPDKGIYAETIWSKKLQLYRIQMRRTLRI